MANVTDAREQRPLLRYSNAAVTLHWLTAVLVLFQIWLGLSFADMADGPRRANLFTLHRTIGATILIRMHEISDFSIRELRELMAA